MFVTSVYRIITENLQMKKNLLLDGFPHHLSKEQKTGPKKIAE